MTASEFENAMLALHNLRNKELEGKRPAYTQQSKDVLYNFKTIAQLTGLKPLQVLNVYKTKHDMALNTYINSGLEAEPIATRCADLINYIELAYALILEEQAAQSN